MAAKHGGHLSVVELLLASGVQVNLQNQVSVLS